MKMGQHTIYWMKSKPYSPLHEGSIAQTNWLYDGLMLTSLALLRNATIQPILQTDDIRSTDPATYDVFTTYEEPTMLQTKLWDIQVCEAPNKLIPQHIGVMREVIR